MQRVNASDGYPNDPCSLQIKDNSYIAVYRSQGKADDEKELKVKANVFYNHNHPTYEYKYCIDDYYFNFDDLGE